MKSSRLAKIARIGCLAGLSLKCLTGCLETGNNDAKVSLINPVNEQTTKSEVEFEWLVPESWTNYTSIIYTDKGENPLDGDYEEYFVVENKSKAKIKLAEGRYGGTWVQWAVRATDNKGNVAESKVESFYVE